MGMDIIIQQQPTSTSTLLEFAASDDVNSFKLALQSSGLSIDDVGFWYTRRIGSNKMGYEQRTPLMVAAQYGSVKVVDFIIESANSVDIINRVSGSDKVTALHCAVAGGSVSSTSIVHRLISASANTNIVDANGNRASDIIAMFPKLPLFKNNKQLDTLLKSESSDSDSISGFSTDSESDSKKEFAVADLPDINNGVYGSDEFRMYCFKIKPCSRAYTHDWTECPFAHPGENARRRDPKKYQYTCVPCPEFKKGSCKKGEECEFAHGVFESWLHPAQYRTRLCKDEIGCSRKVCFFAHKREELRPVYASTGSAIPDVNVSSSPNGFSGSSTPPMSPSYAPLSPNSGASVIIEELRKRTIVEWEAMEKECEERERRRREELMIQEREWEERMSLRRSEWNKRMDDMLNQHRAEMGQIQSRILHEQQNITSQLLTIVSQWSGHPSGLSDHTVASSHYLSPVMQNLHHVNDMVHDDTRVEGDNQEDQFIVD